MANSAGHIKERELVCSEKDLGSAILDFISEAQERLDICVKCHRLPATLGANLDGVQERAVELANRGGQARILTFIDRDSMPSCKAMASVIDIRHAELAQQDGDGFAVSDGGRLLTLAPANKGGEGGRAFRVAETSNAALVAEKQRLFERLWKRAIPADHRFIEVEVGGMIDPRTLQAAMDKTLSVLGVALKSATLEFLESEGITLDGRASYSLLRIRGAMSDAFGDDCAQMFMEHLQKVLVRSIGKA